MTKYISMIMWLGLATSAVSCTAALGIYQHGQVLQADNAPCFSVADSEEANRNPPELATLRVNEILSKGNVQTLWELSFVITDKPPTTLSPKTCIPYKATPLNSETKVPAAELKTGKRYEVNIWSHLVKSPTDEGVSRGYRTFFCLTQDTLNKMTVHQIGWDKERDEWRWDVCGLENPR